MSISTAGSDFVSVTGSQLIFNQAVSSMLVQVGIMDDNVLEELIENFTASLTSSVPRLTLLPDVAVVDIIDDDRKQGVKFLLMIWCAHLCNILCLSSCGFRI